MNLFEAMSQWELWDTLAGWEKWTTSAANLVVVIGGFAALLGLRKLARAIMSYAHATTALAVAQTLAVRDRSTIALEDQATPDGLYSKAAYEAFRFFTERFGEPFGENMSRAKFDEMPETRRGDYRRYLSAMLEMFAFVLRKAPTRAARKAWLEQVIRFDLLAHSVGLHALTRPTFHWPPLPGDLRREANKSRMNADKGEDD